MEDRTPERNELPTTPAQGITGSERVTEVFADGHAQRRVMVPLSLHLETETFERAGCRSRHSCWLCWCLLDTKRGQKRPSARGVNGLFGDRRPSEPPTLCGPCGGCDRPVAEKVKKERSQAPSGRPTPCGAIIATASSSSSDKKWAVERVAAQTEGAVIDGMECC